MKQRQHLYVQMHQYTPTLKISSRFATAETLFKEEKKKPSIPGVSLIFPDDHPSPPFRRVYKVAEGEPRL